MNVVDNISLIGKEKVEEEEKEGSGFVIKNQ
jgi:hypothetical protein